MPNGSFIFLSDAACYNLFMYFLGKKVEKCIQSA